MVVCSGSASTHPPTPVHHSRFIRTALSAAVPSSTTGGHVQAQCDDSTATIGVQRYQFNFSMHVMDELTEDAAA